MGIITLCKRCLCEYLYFRNEKQSWTCPILKVLKRHLSDRVIFAPNEPSKGYINQRFPYFKQEGKNKGTAKSIQSILHVSDDPVSKLENDSESYPWSIPDPERKPE